MLAHIKKHPLLSNGGIIKTADFKANNIHYRQIQQMLNDGIIEKIKTGRYMKAEPDISEADIIARMYPDGALCMYTALFYYGYSDRTPSQWDIAVNRNLSKSRFNIDYPNVCPHYMEPQHLTYGIVAADFGSGADDIKIFDRDRMMCECMVYENKLDREVFSKAVQAYISDPKKRIAQLLEYAERRRITRKIRDRL